MKNYLIWSLFLALIMGSCQQNSKNANKAVFGKYGDTTFTAEGAVNGQELLAMLKGKDSVEVKLKAPINACCQKKGCWMNVDLGKDVEMRVKFKDYGFFVPFNSSGRQSKARVPQSRREVTLLAFWVRVKRKTISSMGSAACR